MPEPFDLKKATSSLFNGLDWFKALMVGLKIAGILFIVFTVYRAFFMPTTKQTQKTQISVASGGTLNLQQTQSSEKKKWFETFGEVYVFAETDGRYGGGVRAGLKF